MTITRKRNKRERVAGLLGALALLSCAFVQPAPAQENAAAGRRPARSLTSEDLLDRASAYVPQPSPNPSAPSSAGIRSAGATYYRDPTGVFTLNFPNGNWRVNARAGSAGRIYHQRSFRRMEAEGFSSATANVYVLAEGSNLAIVDPSRLGADGQRELAAALAARFLSSSSSLVSVEPASTDARAGLRIIADQTIARRVAVRASINVFERQGRLFVVVCCAPPDSFDAHAREFEVISNSLASSVARS
jgi:hypothetical protein